MTSDETVGERITRQVEQRNRCPRGCPWCAATAALLASTSQMNPAGRRPR